MRAFLAIAALAVSAVGCGGTPSDGGGSAGNALAYLPADAATVIFVSTDVDGEQWNQFDEHVFPQFSTEDSGPQSFEEWAQDEAESEGLSWKDDIKPLLGNDFAVAITGEPLSLLGGEGDSSIVGALETRGGDVAQVLEKVGFRPAGDTHQATLYRDEGAEESRVAVRDDVLIVAEDERSLRDALNRRADDEGLEEDAVEEAFTELPSEYFVRAFGTLEEIGSQEELSRYASLPLVEALESWGLTARFGGGDLNLDVAVRLDGDRLDESDLPLVTGEESPEIVLREREVSGGNLNQSQTTVFLLRALRAGHPTSRFVQAVESVERKLGLDFEQEILRQFNGPSASYVSPDGRTFAARSEVRDPESLRKVLPRLAPELPALVEGLQGLQSEGMALLFLFAPDAPAATPMEDVKVDPPETEDGFYRVSGLTGDGPSELHFGLVDDLFVVASDEERAREIAEAGTEPAKGAKGAGVVRADLTKLGEDITGLFFFLPIEGKELVASLEASTDELRARVRLDLD